MQHAVGMADEEDSPLAPTGWPPAVLTQPVEPYMGLTLDEATALATREGCRLVNCTGQSVRTLNLRPQRISVELDDAGLVVGAHRG